METFFVYWDKPETHVRIYTANCSYCNNENLPVTNCSFCKQDCVE